MDDRYVRLARLLVDFSMEVGPGDRVLVESSAAPDEMVLALMRAVCERGGRPFVRTTHSRLKREFILRGGEEDFSAAAAVDLVEMRQMQCYVALRGSNNDYEMASVPMDQKNLYAAMMRPVHDWRVERTRWVVLRWPTPSMAQAAGMGTEEFEDFFFRVCTLDYARMETGMAALKARMERTDRVRITAPGTDISFSIRGIGAIPCGGKRNIPDGEVFTAPVLDSVEGVIAYNAPSIYHGQRFSNVRLRFSAGRIVEATADSEGDINAIFDADGGARRVGEFSFGFNPHITKPMGDILFDEKIAGSIHFTPGQAYANEADNGNRSQVHWDLVLIQRPEYGGGEVSFDGEVIRRDGLFLPDGLRLLNPDHLLARSDGKD
jgi:aminopeptidase